MIRKTIPLLLIGLASFATASLAQVYTYKDEKGRTVISDKKPPGKVRDERVVKGTDGTAEPPAAAASPETPAHDPNIGVDPEIQRLRKAQDEKLRAEDEQKQRDQELQARQELENACKRWRKDLVTLEAGLRVGTMNDQGQFTFLDDTQHENERTRVRALVADKCK